MANADFSQKQNSTPGGFDAGSYREQEPGRKQAVRADPFAAEAGRAGSKAARQPFPPGRRRWP